MTTRRSELDDGPPPELVFRRRVRLGDAMRELWSSRELVGTVARRDFRSRYKQTSLGVAWAVITPVVLMIVFTVFFQRVADVPTGDVPYPLWSYVGLLPWTFFSSSVSSGASSVLFNRPVLNKVYFPREVFPLGSISVAGIDTAIAASVLAVMFVAYGIVPTASTPWVVVLAVIQLVFVAGVTLILAGVVVHLRDVRLVTPMLIQFGLFATPVAYDLSAIPESLQVWYSFVNPLAPLIDGYRRAMLFDQPPDWELVGPAAFSSLLILALGFRLFKRLETGFADVA